MTTRDKSPPLRGARLLTVGKRDGQTVAVFDQGDELVEYEIHGARPPIRPQE